ncbi:MAG: DegV family EDD domain-containing protein [Oscillospiraceae bacterium]|nr:DegV family EDD domain-containing protein [Oscillospiraceae bacterium]
MDKWNRLKNRLNDPSIDFQERIFLLFTMIAEGSVFLVLIADILLGENIVEIAVLLGTVILSPIVALFCLKKHKTKIGSIIIAFSVVFVIMPVTFFFGGGMYGGALIWFSFAYLYIGILLQGKWRFVMLTFLTVLAAAEYYIAYHYPEFIVPHSNAMFYLDSIVSVILIGLVIYIMVWFQNKLFIAENIRAKKEAEKVEELLLAQNRFFSSMSHEIRTPINTIIGLNEMILRENISDEVAEDASNVRSASKMLLHLINDILDMSKLDSGQMQLSPVNYKPGDMLSDLVGMLWIRAKEKGLEFRVNVSPDLPYELTGDEVRIKQILINVVNNAVKYTEKGSVSLSVECGSSENGKLNVIYTVTDTGIGIKKENIPYLFTAFRRVDERNNRHIEGTGLGLSIVKQLVDLMGGKITVNSIYTKGSSFVIEIPQKAASDKKIENINIKDQHESGFNTAYQQKFEAPEARILAVDDNASNLLVITKLLRDTRVRVDTAASGAEALNKTLATNYHVIFMDHLMPEMDGIECLKIIRTQIGGKCRESKIVALTANADSQSRALYEREGFDGYLAKPVSGEEIEKELCRLLPKDIVYMSSSNAEILEETVSWMHSERRKSELAVTTGSVADLPGELAKKYNIAVIPHKICTKNGRFKDGQEIDTDGLLGYIKKTNDNVTAEAPDVKEYEDFFAKQLSGANNIIHFSISSAITNSGWNAAKEAASAFDNVTVIDTGLLTSGQGLIAAKVSRLYSRGMSIKEIMDNIEEIKAKVNTSFIVEDLDFLARAGHISQRVSALTRSLMARPVIKMKKGRLRVDKIYFGTRERAWKRYIDHTLSQSHDIDDEELFITYVGLTSRELESIRKMTEAHIKFKNVYLGKASPAIAVNCGEGSFALIFSYKYTP